MATFGRIVCTVLLISVAMGTVTILGWLSGIPLDDMLAIASVSFGFAVLGAKAVIEVWKEDK